LREHHLAPSEGRGAVDQTIALMEQGLALNVTPPNHHA
jgi:hypothetical protein